MALATIVCSPTNSAEFGNVHDRVIGQPDALAALSERIRTSKAGLEDPSKPVGVFLLVGPSGVGKTETAT